jgi:hypothetical protein
MLPLVEWNEGRLGTHFWLSVETPGFGGPGSLFASLTPEAPDPSVGFVASPAGVVTAGVWQHVALTYDRGSGFARIYRDGIQVGSRAVGDLRPSTYWHLYLGYRAGYGSYRGLLDEVTLFNRALSAQEVSAIHAAGHQGKCPPPPPRPLTFPTEFQWVNPLPMGNLLNRAVYGNNLFVAVGGPGVIFTSADGAAWAQQVSGTTNGLAAVTYGAGLFVVTGEHGTLLTSPDATNWTTRASGTVQALRDGACDGRTFVLVGDAGTLLTSTNGAMWRIRTNTLGQPLMGIACGGGLFVAVGKDGTIVTSADGVSWSTPVSGTSRWLNDVAYGNRTFVAVGYQGTLLTSSDGAVWTRRETGGTQDLFGVGFGSGRFVVVGSPGKLLTSDDGLTWTPRDSRTTEPLYSVASGQGSFVVLGGALVALILNSIDAEEWVQTSSGDTRALYDVTFDAGTFVAVGAHGAILSSSPDGVWRTRESGVPHALRSVARGNGLFVAVGARETILTSPDGIVWTRRPVVIPKPPPDWIVYHSPWDFGAIGYGGGQFVLVTENAMVLLSSDGITWGPASGALGGGGNPAAIPRRVIYGNGYYVAMGGAWSSRDGVTWARGSPPDTPVLDGGDIVFAEGKFSSVKGPAVAFADGVYAAIGEPASGLRPILLSNLAPNTGSSEFGLAHNCNTTRKLHALAFGNGIFVAVGENGAILQSGPIKVP